MFEAEDKAQHRHPLSTQQPCFLCTYCPEDHIEVFKLWSSGLAAPLRLNYLAEHNPGSTLPAPALVIVSTLDLLVRLHLMPLMT